MCKSQPVIFLSFFLLLFILRGLYDKQLALTIKKTFLYQKCVSFFHIISLVRSSVFSVIIQREQLMAKKIYIRWPMVRKGKHFLLFANRETLQVANIGLSVLYNISAQKSLISYSKSETVNSCFKLVNKDGERFGFLELFLMPFITLRTVNLKYSCWIVEKFLIIDRTEMKKCFSHSSPSTTCSLTVKLYKQATLARVFCTI